MNIDEMSDHEKSVMLARLCGFTVFRSGVNGEFDRVTVQAKGWTWTQFDSDKLNLYEPAAMAGAWLVLNWATEHIPGKHGRATALYESIQGIDDFHSSPIWHLSPADAQRLWLDKILSLAIDAGMVDETAVTAD